MIFSFPAAIRPLSLYNTNSTRIPSFGTITPIFSNCEICTKTSFSQLSGVIKPYPFSVLYHLTIPRIIKFPLQ